MLNSVWFLWIAGLILVIALLVVYGGSFYNLVRTRPGKHTSPSEASFYLIMLNCLGDGSRGIHYFEWIRLSVVGSMGVRSQNLHGDSP